MFRIWTAGCPKRTGSCEVSQDEQNKFLEDRGEVAEWPKAAVC